MRKLIMAAFGVLLAAGPVLAQDRPFEVNFGGGVTFPSTGLKADDTKGANGFDAGWNLGVGATYFFKPTFGVQVQYMYHRMSGPDKNITLFPTPVAGVGTSGLIESNMQVNELTFNGVWRPKSSGPLGGYVLAGPGYFHRKIQLTTPSVGYTTICDPYWLVCYPTLVSVDQIIGDRSSNDFGINVGGGLTFGHAAKFYVEFRYVYVWGPEVTPTAANLPAGAANTAGCSGGCTTNAAYFPLTFGFRF